MIQRLDDNEDGCDPINPRITLNAARRMLGMVARNYSDEEIADLLNILYGISEEAFKAHRQGKME
jgi:hypothetical protein